MEWFVQGTYFFVAKFDIFLTILFQAKGIVNTPLTPYLDEELLYNNSLSIDGSKITKIGFVYKHPKMTEAHLRETIAYFSELNFFPKDMA